MTKRFESKSNLTDYELAHRISDIAREDNLEQHSLIRRNHEGYWTFLLVDCDEQCDINCLIKSGEISLDYEWDDPAASLDIKYLENKLKKYNII